MSDVNYSPSAESFTWIDEHRQSDIVVGLDRIDQYTSGERHLLVLEDIGGRPQQFDADTAWGINLRQRS